MREFHLNKQYSKIKVEMLEAESCHLEFTVPWDDEKLTLELVSKLEADGYTVDSREGQRLHGPRHAGNHVVNVKEKK